MYYNIAMKSRQIITQVLKQTTNNNAVRQWKTITTKIINNASQQSTAAPNENLNESTSTAINPVSSKLHLTESCRKKLNDICDNNYLRVIVDGGGCSGFQYKFELDTIVNEDDILFGGTEDTDDTHDTGQQHKKTVIIDTVSLQYCDGATLDYQVELIKSGFRIIGNPKAEQGCSCGASFTLKLD